MTRNRNSNTIHNVYFKGSDSDADCMDMTDKSADETKCKCG